MYASLPMPERNRFLHAAQRRYFTRSATRHASEKRPAIAARSPNASQPICRQRQQRPHSQPSAAPPMPLHLYQLLKMRVMMF